MRALAGNSHQSFTRAPRNPLPPALRLLARFVSGVLILLAIAPLAPAASPAPHAARSLLLDASLNGHVIIAVGERGAIIRSADSGETWEAIVSPTDATLTGVSFANVPVTSDLFFKVTFTMPKPVAICAEGLSKASRR